MVVTEHQGRVTTPVGSGLVAGGENLTGLVLHSLGRLRGRLIILAWVRRLPCLAPSWPFRTLTLIRHKFFERKYYLATSMKGK